MQSNKKSLSTSTPIRRSCPFPGAAVLIDELIFIRTDSRTPTGLESTGSWTMDGLPNKVPGHENLDKLLNITR